jgi:CDP-paratose 2-epimerase
MKVVVTGSSGLIGSEAVSFYAEEGWDVVGIDNDMRADFFGPSGSTIWNRDRLIKKYKNFASNDVDIRDEEKIAGLFKDINPDLIIHCAAQPSHDWAAKDPVKDFTVNANGTLSLLEAFRNHCPDAIFINMSTNKVYGDNPNYLPLKELKFRYDYADKKYENGIPEDFSIDNCKHSLFGVSKTAGDLLAQEYGRYFDLNIGVFRGGCLTGPVHSAVELHGFLSYLAKCIIHGKPYTIFGYKGKQVRDQIHSRDVILSFEAFRKNPRKGEVYNLGGGKGNAASILECINKICELTGKEFNPEYSGVNRIGDHICYYSNLKKLKSHFPEWDITVSLDQIIKEIVDFELSQ